MQMLLMSGKVVQRFEANSGKQSESNILHQLTNTERVHGFKQRVHETKSKLNGQPYGQTAAIRCIYYSIPTRA